MNGLIDENKTETIIKQNMAWEMRHSLGTGFFNKLLDMLETIGWHWADAKPKQILVAEKLVLDNFEVDEQDFETRMRHLLLNRHLWSDNPEDKIRRCALRAKRQAAWTRKPNAWIHKRS